jgi:hypothetical protein
MCKDYIEYFCKMSVVFDIVNLYMCTCDLL